jgi:putative FmdB family regulatory protein
MPIYEFHCGACEHSFEVTLSIKAKRPKQCPKCRGRKQFEQVIGVPTFFVKGNITTIGQQVELNEKKAGKELVQRRAEKKHIGEQKGEFSGTLYEGSNVVKKKYDDSVPWYREPGEKILDTTKVKNVDKFVKTGKV